ncbi:DUF2974 domain-containing protein [Paenibacillus sp. TRM 82003]|nr:DUF2974 domain-containing protein [Paenibacillus sp. TRM 82003]
MSDKLTDVQLKQISQLVYLDVIGETGAGLPLALTRLYKDRQERITVGDLLDYYQGKGKFAYTEEGVLRLQERFPNDLNGRSELDYWQELLAELDRPDVRSWAITNVKSHNLPEQTGFVAFAVETSPGTKVVAFRGSEPMEDPTYRNDWSNNADTSYDAISPQQKDAVRYIQRLQQTSGDGIDALYLTGHSLGGNLALYSSFRLDERYREKLVSATTFNAPGFNEQVLDAHREVIDRLNGGGQLTEFRNREDLVPALFLNPSKGVYVETLSEGFGFSHHSMFSLAIDETGTGFVEASRRGILPHVVQNITIGMLEAVPDGMKRLVVQEVFNLWEGKIEPYHVLAAVAAGAALVVGGPAALAASLMAALRFVVGLYVIGFIKSTLIPWVRDRLEQLGAAIRDFCERSVAYFADMLASALRAANRFGAAIAGFVDDARRALSSFFRGAEAGLHRFARDAALFVDVQRDRWERLKAGVAERAGELARSIQSRVREEKDRFVAGVKSYARAALRDAAASVARRAAAVYVGTAAIARGVRLEADVARLGRLRRLLRRHEERMADRIDGLLREADRAVSDAAGSYGESYVQQQAQRTRAAIEQLRADRRRLGASLDHLSDATRRAAETYSALEIRITAAARGAAAAWR